MRQNAPIAAGNAKKIAASIKMETAILTLRVFAAFLFMPLFCVERNEQ
jgi:hypothetical protein